MSSGIRDDWQARLKEKMGDSHATQGDQSANGFRKDHQTETAPDPGQTSGKWGPERMAEEMRPKPAQEEGKFSDSSCDSSTPEDDTLPGGYVLLPRTVMESAGDLPPCAREVFVWGLLKANFKDHGKIRRGEVLTNYREIVEALSWTIGWRRESYSRDQVSAAMKTLKRTAMITTRKTTRGLIINICNYDKYQSPQSYERHNEDNRKTIGKPHDKGKNKGKNKTPLSGKPDQKLYQQIIDHLNGVTGRSFSASSKKTRSLINGRYSEGFRLQDFIAVIDDRNRRWTGDPKMSEFLRPDTLFSTKFESYRQVCGENGETKPSGQAVDCSTCIGFDIPTATCKKDNPASCRHYRRNQ